VPDIQMPLEEAIAKRKQEARLAGNSWAQRELVDFPELKYEIIAHVFKRNIPLPISSRWEPIFKTRGFSVEVLEPLAFREPSLLVPYAEDFFQGAYDYIQRETEELEDQSTNIPPGGP
jgi:hypothetical protein